MKKTLYVTFAALVITTLLLSACRPAGGNVDQSNLKRVANPDASSSAVQELVSGNDLFAFDLYQAVRVSGGNLVYSPYSISLAFAMAYGGARGETASQMAAALHYTLPADQFHPAFNALDLELAGRPNQATDVPEADRFQLSIANSLWGQKDFPFLSDYLDLLATNYGAGLRLVDFENAPESARQQINNWISDQTKKRIQNIIPPGAIDPTTRLVLANAIYFKALWEIEFNANDTSDEPFHLINGETVNVPMMSIGHPENFSYAAGSGWQAISLPYKGSLNEMVVIVPDAGTFDSFEAGLTAERYNEILAAMAPQLVALSMPKFTFETQYDLNDALAGLGMQDAFDPAAADFSGMDGKRDLSISDVLHKAFVAVDEKGTEAAAATVLVMVGSAMPAPSLELTIDRPFFFFIRDLPSGTILFMGRVLNPAE